MQLSCYVSGKALWTLRKGFRDKATVDSGPKKLSKVYLLSKNVYVRPQMCGTWCLGTESCKFLLGVLTVGHALHCILDQQRWDVCPSLQCRGCLTTGMKPHLPFTLPLFLMTACSECTPQSEDLPEDALCYGDVIQYNMQDSFKLPLQLTEGQQVI